jgi:hypothetical protein
MERDPHAVHGSFSTAKADYGGSAGAILYEAEGEAVERGQRSVGTSCLRCGVGHGIYI